MKQRAMFRYGTSDACDQKPLLQALAKSAYFALDVYLLSCVHLVGRKRPLALRLGK